MQGTYKGTYTYHKHPRLMGQETKFTIIITDCDGTSFTGTVTDDVENGGSRGEGTIKGSIKNDKIEFIKQMPIMTLGTKDGKRIEVAKKHRPVDYSGTFIGDTFEGDWKIKRGMIFNTFLIAFGIGTTGTWKMAKV